MQEGNALAYNSQFTRAAQANPQLSHRIDMLCLAILFVGFFSCLIRSDYNFAVVLFCYFIWQQRKDSLGLKIIFAGIVSVIVVDIIFACTEMRVWMSDDPDNNIWQTLRPMHNFGVFCFALIMILKLILVFVLVRGIQAVPKSSSVSYS